MKTTSSRTFWIILAAAALGGFWWWKNSSDNGDGKNKPPTAVRIAIADRRDVPLTLETVGTIVANESVAVRARLDSQLVEVKFKDGDYVNQGDLLFVLDDRTLKAQLNELLANTARDRAQLENLRLQYDRNKELAKKGFQSAAALDTSRAAYEAQKATVGATQATVENLKVQLGYTQITAPISGRTGTINITVGNNVKTNDAQPMVTINQVKPIRAHLSLPQRYLDSVRSAMAKGAVTVEALREGSPDASQGVLEYIDNAVDQSTGTFAARASFPNDDEKLWPGMFVRLKLKLGEEKQVLTLPEVAIQHGQSGDYVFTVVSDIANKRNVKVSRMQDGMAIVDSGVGPGDPVVVDGLMSLKDGSKVNVQRNEK